MKIEASGSKEIFKSNREGFKTDPYYTPMITKYLEIVYLVGGEELKAEVFMGSNRASVHGKNMYSYMKENNLANMNESVFKAALKEATVKTNLLTDISILYKENKNQEALQMSVNIIRAVKDLEFVKNVVENEKYSTTSKFKTWLYFILSEITFEKDHVTFDIEHEAKKSLAYSFLNIITMRFEKFDLEDIEGTLRYIEYLCDALGYCKTSSTEIVREERKIARVMLKFIEANELIDFIKDNVDKDDIEEELEQADVKSLEDLFKIYEEEPFS